MIAKFGRYEVEALCFEDDSDDSGIMFCEEEEAILFGVYRRNDKGFAISIQDFKVKENALEFAKHQYEKELK